MKKTNLVIMILISIIVVSIVAVIVGISVWNRDDKKDADVKKEEKVSEVILDDCTDEYEIMQEEIAKVNSNEEKISPNCKLVLTRYYKECKDSINEYLQVPEPLVNCTKNQIQEQYKDWEIKEFSSDQVILYKEFEGNCGEHYILKNEEGKIVIYKLLENGKESLYEKTSIYIEYLPEKDKLAIKDGLKVNGKEKLNKLIESFE